MTTADTPRPTSKDRAAVYIKVAMAAIDEAGGSLPARAVRKAIAAQVDMTGHDLARSEKTGYIRWESVLSHYSRYCVEAGFIRKSGGYRWWHLTPEGRDAMTLPAPDLLDKAMRLHRDRKAARPDDTAADGGETPAAADDDAAAETMEPASVLETALSESRAKIEAFVAALGPYEFQDLVAALLRGMGYATPVIAPPGPDGGTDIVAYPDPLGAKTPHVRVQVKHRATGKATREEVAALRGIIRQDREIGLFVSSGGFTSKALQEARHGAVHIETMDLDGFLESWMTYYDRLSEEDRGLLRLRPVYFLAPS